MTAEQARALGERCVAVAAGWRRGMCNLAGEVVVEVSSEGWPRFEGDDHFTHPSDAGIPDLRDPATRGAALEVVRERWRGTVWIGGQFIRPGRIAWVVCGLHVEDGRRVNGADGFDSEAEALVAALEAAPR